VQANAILFELGSLGRFRINELRGFECVGEYTGVEDSSVLRRRPQRHFTAGRAGLHDTLLSGFIGYATPPGATRVLFLSGIDKLLDSPTVDGVARESTASAIVLTVGVDLLRTLCARSSLIIGGRYSFAERNLNLTYLGIGPHLLRIGVGLRVRIN
jgi:hypothetical protein